MSAAAREALDREEMITMMYWYGSGMSGWGYALMTISLILFWGAVIFGVVVHDNTCSYSPRSPLMPCSDLPPAGSASATA